MPETQNIIADVTADTGDNGIEEPTTPSEPATTDAAPPDERTANNEAARRRQQLRKAERERDAFAAKVESLQRAEALRLASATLAEPEDLFALGEVAVVDLLDADDNLDKERVAGVVAKIIERRPGLHKDGRRPTGYHNFGQGQPAPRSHTAASWSRALSR
ncbi:hypothetical protein P9209_00075 [Prescottella defluvii]|nr:hypothetical protein P9209_00075 [Prescottella defluvii]